MYYRFTLLFSLLFAINIVKAQIITHTYEFPAPTIEIINNEAKITLLDCWSTGKPGEPQLPVKGGTLLLPPATGAINIEFEHPQPISLGNRYYIAPQQTPHPLSAPGPFPPTPENQTIYQANQFFPSDLAGELQTNFKCGYSLAQFTVHPVVYNPVTGEIAYYPWIRVRISAQPTTSAINAHNQFFRGIAQDRQEVERLIDNPSDISDYGSNILDDTDDDDIDFLIITNEALMSSFQVLSDYKNARGTRTEIVLKSWIVSNYTGIDVPDQIRNCIIDYYNLHNIRYVLLAGDNEIIPKRSLYANAWGEIDYDIAADLYYGCLDGNWNADGDNMWGEPNEADLLGEVYPGRAAVDSPTEAEHFIQKQIDYQSTPVADELTEGLMLGEYLEWAVWGSAYKEEIRLGTSNWGYTTVGFPNWFEVDTLYDYPGFYWSAMGNLLPLLNQGPQLVNHLGHANNTYALKFNGGQVNDDNMTNNGVNHNYYIIYSQGCYCNSWDNRLPNFGYTGSEAISEAWTTIANGAVCFIGNTRYGWGDYNTTNGPSQYYDRQFFDAVFGENIYQIGRAHQDSKEDCIPYIYDISFYTYYECGLLGDPTLEIWTQMPAPIIVVCDTMISIGDSTFSLQAQGISGALCAISQNGDLLGSATTGSLGSALIDLSSPIASTDQVRLMVTKHNYLPYDVYLDVYVPDAPNLICQNCQVNDVSGDADGILDLGEVSYFDLTVVNFGGVNANGVDVSLHSEDIYVSVLDSIAELGEILHDATVFSPEAFQLEIAPDVPDGHQVDFSFTLTDSAGNIWNSEFDFAISAPSVIITGVEVDDGNDLRLQPDESAQVIVTLTNTGSGEARQLQGHILTDNPYLDIISSDGIITLLEPNCTATLSPPFSVYAQPSCPLSENIPVYLTLTDEMGYEQGQLFAIVIGGIIETFENGVGTWTHTAITPDFNDQWVLSQQRNYTPGGTTSWHCGPADGANYGAYLDAGLVSPEYAIQPGATLKFRHWLNAEYSPSQPGFCYDGGRVEMSLNNSVFFQIYPVGGYNYYIKNSPDMGPFQALSQVYSGDILWEEAVFNVGIYPPGTARFRFRFGSNGAGAREGWYIDDLEMFYNAPVLSPSNFTGEWADSVTVHLSWNSPGFAPLLNGKVNGRESEALLHYHVYRNGGLVADNIQALNYDDDMRFLTPGEYTYYVTAYFSNGESDPTPSLTFYYLVQSVTGNENLIPDHYFAQANYPNPFNPQTTIRYGLPEMAQVKIAVYNLLGRQIEILYDGMQEPGIHTIIWKADSFPSGIYFFQLQAGSFTAKGKMVLLK